MKRVLFAALVMVGGLVLIGRAARPVAADTIGAIAVRERAEALLFREDLTLDQITELQIEYGKTLRLLAGELPGWECVQASLENPRVRLSFDAAGPVLLEGDQSYAVIFTLTVKGLGSRSAGPFDLDVSDPEVRAVAGSSDPVAVLSQLGRAWIEDLIRQFSPCKLTLEFKLEGAAQISDASFVSQYAGVVRDLTLDREGRASFAIPLDAILSVTRSPCTTAFQIAGARLEGRVEYRDDHLHFSRLDVSHQQITGSAQCASSTCSYIDQGIAGGSCAWPTGSGPATEGPNQPFTTSFGLFAGTGIDLAAAGTLLMGMEDGASASLSRPLLSNPRLSGWLGSVILGYGGR